MSSSSPFLTIEKTGEDTIHWTIQLLENAGLRVIPTFNLQEARLSQADCPCPHHGTEACDCQMSILLVYPTEAAPVSLLLRSFHETTWFYLVDTPEQPVDHNVGSLIQEVLAQHTADGARNGE